MVSLHVFSVLGILEKIGYLGGLLEYTVSELGHRTDHRISWWTTKLAVGWACIFCNLYHMSVRGAWMKPWAGIVKWGMEPGCEAFGWDEFGFGDLCAVTQFFSTSSQAPILLSFSPAMISVPMQIEFFLGNADNLRMIILGCKRLYWILVDGRRHCVWR